MKILITGSAGFVGRSLVLHLQKAGHFIFGLDLEQDHLSNKSIQADLEKISHIPFDFDLCIHLASCCGGILHNHTTDTIENYEIELLKSVKNLCSQKNCNRIIYTSSSCVFERTENVAHGPLQESNQFSFYGKAKKLGEDFIQSHFDEFVIVRPTNIFGASQICHDRPYGHSQVIPELLKKIDQGTVLEVFGDGSQIRNFIHVSDVCLFIEKVLENPKQAWFNIRSDIHITIETLAKELIKFRKKDISIQYKPEFMKLEPNPLPCYNIDELQQLDWSPKIKDIITGLNN